MFTRRVTMAAALIGLSLRAVATAAPVHLSAPSEKTAISPRPARRRRALPATSSPAFRRSRGPQAKPKRRPNMLHVSRRVRRRHRRAA